MREVVAAHDRRVVGHRAGHAQLRAVAVHRDPVVRGVQQVGLARQRPGLRRQRQVRDPQGPAGVEVELDEAVQERQLQVGHALVGGEDHRPDGGAHPGNAGGGQRRADVEAPQDRVRARVDDLQDAFALRRVELGPVQRGVDAADARVEDPRAVAREVVLVRLIARRELADDGAALRVDHVDLAGERGGDEQPRAIGRDRHVVGAIALDLHAPGDLACPEVQCDDVAQARPRDVERAPVVRRERVIDVLRVALADEQVVGVEDAQRDRVGRDLGAALRQVGDDVQPREDLLRARVDDVGGAVPVVGDDEHVAGGAGGLDGRRGQRDAERQRETGSRGHRGASSGAAHDRAIVVRRATSS